MISLGSGARMRCPSSSSGEVVVRVVDLEHPAIDATMMPMIMAPFIPYHLGRDGEKCVIPISARLRSNASVVAKPPGPRRLGSIPFL